MVGVTVMPAVCVRVRLKLRMSKMLSEDSNCFFNGVLILADTGLDQGVKSVPIKVDAGIPLAGDVRIIVIRVVLEHLHRILNVLRVILALVGTVRVNESVLSVLAVDYRLLAEKLAQVPEEVGLDAVDDIRALRFLVATVSFLELKSMAL